MNEMLKPCPFCGWRKCFLFDSKDSPYWVECPDCYAQGGVGETEAEAITAWNTRPTPPSLDRGDIVERLREKIARIAYEHSPAMTRDQFCTYPYSFHLAKAYMNVSGSCHKAVDDAYTLAAALLEALSVYCIDGREKQAGDPAGNHALLASLTEPVPVSAHSGDGQAQVERDG